MPFPFPQFMKMDKAELAKFTGIYAVNYYFWNGLEYAVKFAFIISEKYSDKNLFDRS
jgi:hypothetical protein